MWGFIKLLITGQCSLAHKQSNERTHAQTCARVFQFCYEISDCFATWWLGDDFFFVKSEFYSIIAKRSSATVDLI